MTGVTLFARVAAVAVVTVAAAAGLPAVAASAVDAPAGMPPVQAARTSAAPDDRRDSATPIAVVRDATTPDAAAALSDGERRRVVSQIDEVGRRGFLYAVSRRATADSAAAPTLFLYGTIHLGQIGREPFNRPMVEALRASRRLVLEADPTDSAAAQALAWSLGRYPDGDGLQRHLPPALWTRVRTFGARLGLPADRVDRIRPWLLANMVGLTQLSGAGLDPMLGSELYLAGFARAAGLPIVEIEGLDAQLRLLAAQPEPVQAAQLEEALSDADEGTADGDAGGDGRALFSLWLGGDRAAGDALVAQLHRAAEKKVFDRYFVDVLLDARNRAMADQAERRLGDGGNTFFAVGALHLFGETGLLAELARRGYGVVDLQDPPDVR